MRLLVKKATIVDPGSKHNGKQRDILIEKGVITEISSSINNDSAKTFSEPGLHVSPGWVDFCADFCDPGFEYKEDILSGLNAAAKGGFTNVLLMPGGSPTFDTKGTIEYARLKSSGHVCHLSIAGTISESRKGEQLAELLDLQRAGAKAFTDYKNPVDSTELMNRALEYARNSKCLVLSFPHDDGVSKGGVMHEGASSVSLGMKGIPAAAETMRLARDLNLLEYTGGKMHVLQVSSAESLELIKKAKKKGLAVTCGVSAAHLYFTDEDLSTFDSEFKVLPPFRSESDRKALIKGLKDGTIDVICSDHQPQDVEHKRKEFEHADFGISAIESAFSVANTALKDQLSLDQIVEKMAINPRTILGLNMASVSKGSEADLTFFKPNESVTHDRDSMVSRSTNTPFAGIELSGKVLGVVNQDKSTL